MQTVKVKISEVKSNPNNPRLIKDEKFKKLVQSIKDFPQMLEVRPIVVNDDMVVLGGNMRLKACKEAGLKEIPIIKASQFTEEQQKEFIIKDNVGFGEWDWDIIANEWDAEQVAEWGLDVPDFKVEAEAEEDDFDTTPPETPITVLGDLYEIGSHRLLCGDSTDSDQVARLMNGEKADMVFTDPPYLMGFTGNVHSDGSKSLNSKYDNIKNDKLDDAESGIFLSKIVLIIKEFCKGSYYLCFYRLGVEKIINALMQNGLNYKALIIWQKNNHNLSNSDYQSIYEPIIYGWNLEHNFYGSRSNFDCIQAKRTKQNEPQITTQGKSVYIKNGNNFYKFEKLKTKPNNYIEAEPSITFNIFDGSNDIWQIDKTKANTLHPTMKPVELCEKAILNSSKQYNIVLDLFTGSGSTMVASHQLKRKCYGLELDPKYCDVIVKRMKKLDPSLTIKRNGVVTNDFD